METQAEYEKRLTALGLDPAHPIQQGKRYRVTGWSTHNPEQVMTVWVASVSDTQVTGQVREDNYPLVSTSRWSREVARRWVWTEIDE